MLQHYFHSPKIIVQLCTLRLLCCACQGVSMRASGAQGNRVEELQPWGSTSPGRRKGNIMKMLWEPFEEKRVFWVMIQIILYFQRLMISPHLQILLLCVSKPINDKGLAICLQRTWGTGKTKTDCKAEQKKGLEWNNGGRKGSRIKIPSC